MSVFGMRAHWRFAQNSIYTNAFLTRFSGAPTANDWFPLHVMVESSFKTLIKTTRAAINSLTVALQPGQSESVARMGNTMSYAIANFENGLALRFVFKLDLLN